MEFLIEETDILPENFNENVSYPLVWEVTNDPNWPGALNRYSLTKMRVRESEESDAIFVDFKV